MPPHDPPEPRLYRDLASWWPLLSAPADYVEEAAFFRQVFLEACPFQPRTMLELGSGGGNNASHLKAHFQLTLVDRSPGMLAVSRALNPECEHVEGDMRDVRLGRTFDVVLIHDAITYVTSKLDLYRVMETSFAHCRPGGAALFVPDCVLETFAPSTNHGGEDGVGRALRYLEWVRPPDPRTGQYFVDFAYLLHEDGQPMRVEHDRHEHGVFARGDWMSLLRDAGFAPEILHDPWRQDVFLAKRHATAAQVRAEQPGDHAAIRAVHESAFPTKAEANLVDALRVSGQLTISLVAELGSEMVGHVAFSPVEVSGVTGLGLAPVAVTPRCQRQGVGSQLVRAGLAACGRACTPFVVVLGHPAYYPRFGFVRASDLGLTNEYGADEAFRVVELRPGGLPSGGGLVRYAPEFAAFE